MGARITQLLVEPVLNHRHPVFCHQLHESLSFLGRHHNTGWIVVGRYEVRTVILPFLQRPLQLTQVDAVRLHSHSSDVKAVQPQIFECRMMGRILAEHRSVPLTQCRQHDIKALREPVRNQHILAAHIYAFVLHVLPQIIY
ncbi:hypothetical protein D3C81_1669420 [compost metagenome]